MRSLMALALVALAGCDDLADLPESPPLSVPGVTLASTTPPSRDGPPLLAQAMPTSFTPGLCVPGQQCPITPPPPPMPPGMMPGQMPPGMQPGQMPPGMQPGQVPPGMQPGQMPMQPGVGGPLTLAPGFSPDPAIARGFAGGPVEAAAMTQAAEGCVGYLPAQPNHVVTLVGAFTLLRILVNGGGQDTTLVVRGPDGVFRCNDDTVLGEVVDPTLAGAFPPGSYQIWVGMYAQGEPIPYVLGLTELPQVTHAALVMPVQ